MPVEQLTYSDLKHEIHKRLNGNMSQADVASVMNAFVTEVQDCLVNGYAVSIPGLFKMKPVLKNGRRKGSIVRNPFTGESRTLTKDMPAKFSVKMSKSPTLSQKFPSQRTKAGKALVEILSD